MPSFYPKVKPHTVGIIYPLAFIMIIFIQYLSEDMTKQSNERLASTHHTQFVQLWFLKSKNCEPLKSLLRLHNVKSNVTHCWVHCNYHDNLWWSVYHVQYPLSTIHLIKTYTLLPELSELEIQYLNCQICIPNNVCNHCKVLLNTIFNISHDVSHLTFIST